MRSLRGLLSEAKAQAEARLPPDVVRRASKLRSSLREHAPQAVSGALARLGWVERQAPPAGISGSDTRTAETLQRVKSKATSGLKPEDSLVVVYATPEETDAVAQIEALFEGVDTVLRVMDLRREPPQTRTQLARQTGVMVPPYVYINGRYWGAHYEMETLAASGDLPHIVANRLDALSEDARRLGRLKESYDDDISPANILKRWRMGHILCVDDLDAWFEVEKNGAERFYYQGSPRSVAKMGEVADAIARAVEAGESEASWQLEPTVALG